jgi:hypothetical protein
MTQGRATPILVVGLNRSGTKWLSNLLCNHPQVYGVQSPRHGGIIETNMFGAMSSVVGDIRTIENYVALLELWSQTDFVTATGIEKDFLYALRPRPTSCLRLFRCLMDEAARRAGVRHWLQKTSPLEAREVLREFADARVIVIERDLVETLESRVQLRRTRGTPFSVTRGALESVYHRKLLDRVRRERPVLEVTYEALRRDTKGELGRICAGLGLDFDPAVLEARYRPNTSFQGPGPGAARAVLSAGELARVRAIAALGRLAPTPLLDAARALLRSRAPHLVPGTFSEIVARRGLEGPAGPRGSS